MRGKSDHVSNHHDDAAAQDMLCTDMYLSTWLGSWDVSMCTYVSVAGRVCMCVLVAIHVCVNLYLYMLYVYYVVYTLAVCIL